MKKKKKSKFLIMRMSIEEKDALKKIAKSEGMSISDLIRYLLRNYAILKEYIQQLIK